MARLGPRGDRNSARRPRRLDAIYENDGAIYVEVRFGADRLLAIPNFMDLFRQAEKRVQSRHPALRAEAIGYVEVWGDSPRRDVEGNKLNARVRAAPDGLAGPYDATDDQEVWRTAYEWADRAASAGRSPCARASSSTPGVHSRM